MVPGAALLLTVCEVSKAAPFSFETACVGHAGLQPQASLRALDGSLVAGGDVGHARREAGFEDLMGQRAEREGQTAHRSEIVDGHQIRTHERDTRHGSGLQLFLPARRFAAA